MIIKYLIAGLGAAILTVGAALLWYRFTDHPRPAALDKVHEMVINTPTGQRLTEILGIVDVPSEGPVNLASAGASLVGSVAGIVQEKVSEAASSIVVRELIRRYNQLPQEKKTEIKSVLCVEEETQTQE